MTIDRPLEGVRVLDLTRLLPGPFGTLVLADMGAQVDKLEDPHAGDYLRHLPPLVGDHGAAFLALNRGKRSIVVDLQAAEGSAVLERMLPRYDVLVEQFRPGVLDRLGLPHASLRARAPRLIVAALTGYGQTGPLARRAGHDINYLARSGLLGLTGPRDRPPQPPGFQLADVSGGMWLVIAVLGALRTRERTGEGTVLDVAMSEGTMAFALAQLAQLATGATGSVPQRGAEPLTGGVARYGTYATKDGGYVALGALEPKFWNAFCEGVGLRSDASALIPGEHQLVLRAKLEAIFAERTRDEWAEFGAVRDCCLEPVLTPAELRSDPHLQARGVFVERASPFGATVELRLPVGDPARGSAAPRAGEHTAEILREAGWSDGEIEDLRTKRVVAGGGGR